jgi:uncharacterized Zn-finger protein
MPFGVDTPQTPPGMPSGEHEIIHVDDRVVACDGGNAGLGHPRVWLRIVHEHQMEGRCLAAQCPVSDAPGFST